MAEAIDPEFEISLVIALRMIRQQLRVGYAGRHPHRRDAAADAIAKAVIEHLQRSGWTISHPPTPLPLYRSQRA